MTIRIVIQPTQLTKKASDQIYPRIKALQRWEFIKRKIKKKIRHFAPNVIAVVASVSMKLAIQER